MPRLEFSAHDATIHKAIVVSFDLGGFSDFCNQPEASFAAPRLAKRVFDFLNETLGDKDDSDGLNSIKPGILVVPSFIKFTGDGALMLWLLPKNQDFPQKFCNLLVASIRGFQQRVQAALPACEKEWRVHKLPSRLRVGIATGIVYAMRPPHAFTGFTAPSDYVGYCINLAVRLQNHCPQMGFIVHGHLHPELAGIERSTAIKLKGSQPEPVAFFRDDRVRVTEAEFAAKFKAQDGS
jgi:class 3 adenylate cyclase